MKGEVYFLRYLPMFTTQKKNKERGLGVQLGGTVFV